MRLFIAVDISQTLREHLTRLQSRLSAEGQVNVRWVRAPGIHLTLRFLGDVSRERLDLLRRELSPGAPIPPFRAAPGRLGVFPPRGRPRVLFVSLEESQPLAALAAWVAARVESAGFPQEDRPFTPHLTLGRFTPEARPRARGLGEVPEEMAEAAIEVDRFAVFQSHLEPAGARYELLDEFPLLGGTKA